MPGILATLAASVGSAGVQELLRRRAEAQQKRKNDRRRAFDNLVGSLDPERQVGAGGTPQVPRGTLTALINDPTTRALLEQILAGQLSKIGKNPKTSSLLGNSFATGASRLLR